MIACCAIVRSIIVEHIASYMDLHTPPLIDGIRGNRMWLRQFTPLLPAPAAPTLSPTVNLPFFLSSFRVIGDSESSSVSGYALDQLKIRALPVAISSPPSTLSIWYSIHAVTCSSSSGSAPRSALRRRPPGSGHLSTPPSGTPRLQILGTDRTKPGVTDLAVHPSGRAAITVGRDCSLALINLVRGRRSFSCRLDREASIVKYECGDGGRFFMVSEERITVHDSEDAKMIHELNGQKRVLCVAPGENGVLFTSGEDRCITAWDTTSGKNAYSIENAHQTRVKGLVVLKNGSMSDTSGESNLIASASSDGVIRVWDARMIAKDKPNHLAEADTKSRLTCLAGSSKKCEF
ncbi:hypothetical protein ZIOFF_050870 [Zingiber officinale]|uniref:Uncharacterized protein n=1 Tax=Zingiber officinale TaxID=94328 RepID=A0A8J5FJL3_ZINOF|nr:hypothetical protein ZIOFF_050870 [Zingiber officinale]